MSSFNCDITEQYLDKLYDDLQKEQQRLLQDIKTSKEFDLRKEVDNQKQFSLLNTLMINTLRFRNLRKKMQQKLDN
jgi:hypothetical protein